MKAIKKDQKAGHGAKMKQAKAGAKLEMVKGPNGNMVPFYAADGKGKMKHGGALKKMKAKYGAKMKNGGKMKKVKKKDKESLEAAKKAIEEKSIIMRYGNKEGAFSEGSLEKIGVIGRQNRKKFGEMENVDGDPIVGVLNKKAISKRKVTPKVKKTNPR
tara:strand:+ start:2721 stop:3197 length:477 start_codon:yes stop_codon:yes gene_type:complete